MTAESNDKKPVFTGEDLLDLIHGSTSPLVGAIINLRVYLSTRGVNGNTALYVTTAEAGKTEILT